MSSSINKGPADSGSVAGGTGAPSNGPRKPADAKGAAAAKAFFEKEREFKGAYSKEVFQVLYWSYRPYLIPCLLWILFGWAGRILLMGNTRLMGIWIDSLGARPHVPDFARGWTSADYFNALLGCSIAGFVFTVVFRLSFSRLSVKAISHIYDEVTVRVSRYPIGFFDRTPVGRIVTRFSSDYGNMFRMFGGPLSEFFGIMFDLAATAVLLAEAHWMGLTCYVLLLGLNLTVYLLNKKKIRLARRESSHKRSPGVAHFAETVQGASVIRVFGKDATFLRRFAMLDSEYIETKFHATRVNIAYAAQMMVSTYGVAFLSGVAGLWLITRGQISPGELAAIMVLLNLAGGSFQMFFDWMAQLEDAFVGVERMNEYLRLPLEPESALPPIAQFPTGHPKITATEARAENTPPVPVPAIALSIRDLWFRYGPELPWILRGLTCDIRAGERIGIVGRTGAGKSSLFQALQGFYPVDKGQILWDGRELGLKAARRLLAVVPQDPVLFNSSVRENLDLLIGHDRTREGPLAASLARVGLDTWLERHPHPLDTFIEEKGKNLSAGEKQLFVMARMSLVDRPLVLMDEATSSIDPQTEEKLVRAIGDIFRGRTQIIIAHRLSTIESCDRILWLKDGRVERFDTPAKVLSGFRGDEIGT